MRSVCTLPVRQAAITMLALGGLLASAAPVSAQGFGLGARLAWVNPDVTPTSTWIPCASSAVRCASSPQRFGLEVSLDRHSESFELLNQKVTETPIQASLLLRLGAAAWLRSCWAGRLVSAQGRGARRPRGLERQHDRVRLACRRRPGDPAGRHFGIHGDYRYTFLDFGDDDDDDEDEGFIGGLLPGHRGSMWTLGATVYF